MLKPAPVVLFAYRRPNHLSRTLRALKHNELAKSTDLIVYCDAAKTEAHSSEVNAVREIVKKTDGFASVRYVFRQRNMGLAESTIDGLTEVLKEHERAIMLEDDNVTSPYFLTYMNEALEKYSNDDRVISIHGYMYPVKETLPEAFFIPGADTWGWGTWRRGWALFDRDGKKLLDELKRRGLLKKFDFNGAYPFSKMLEGQIRGANNSWSIRWYASAFLAGKLTLYPSRSLVQNIGHDDSGTHCAGSDVYDVDLRLTPIDLSNVQVTASLEGLKSFENFFRQTRRKDLLGKVLRRIKKTLSKTTA